MNAKFITALERKYTYKMSQKGMVFIFYIVSKTRTP
jgi:hypothetical protein